MLVMPLFKSPVSNLYILMKYVIFLKMLFDLSQTVWSTDK